MEHHSDDDFFEEEEEEVVVENVGEANPEPSKNPLEMKAVPAAESPESPSPSVSPGTPSPVAMSPPPVSPVGDALSFLGFYTKDNFVNLEQWAVNSRGLRWTPDYPLEERETSPNLKNLSPLHNRSAVGNQTGAPCGGSPHLSVAGLPFRV